MISRLREYLKYDQDSGQLIWIKQKSPKAPVGSVAGTLSSSGYITLGFDGKVLKAHRVAWMLFYNEVPDSDIDHKNCVKSDNRIQNLRLATKPENAFNQRRASNNTSGIKGVSWDSTRCKWRVSLCTKGIRKTVGYLESLEDARVLIDFHRQLQHGEFANEG